MPHRSTLVFTVLLTLLAADLGAQQPTAAQPVPGAISKADRERALDILYYVSKGIQDIYYDPKMAGLDWNAVTERARAKIVASNSLNEALTQIAVAVSALNDSHTRFRPPARPYSMDFGFEYQMIWNRCLVKRVRPGSDGEAKGLKPGDEVLTINGTTPNRQNLPGEGSLGRRAGNGSKGKDHDSPKPEVPDRRRCLIRSDPPQPERPAPNADAIGAARRRGRS